MQIYKKNFLDIAKSEKFLLYSIIWKTIAPFESLIPLYIIYRYGQSEKKSSTFCRFFARTVLFFIKLFYLCTDFMALNALWGMPSRVESRVLWKNEKKLCENFAVSKKSVYFAPRLVAICRCSSVGQSSWFVISWSGVRIPPSAPTQPTKGKIPEWPNGADCKSAGFYLRWFESISSH